MFAVGVVLFIAGGLIIAMAYTWLELDLISMVLGVLLCLGGIFLVSVVMVPKIWPLFALLMNLSYAPTISDASPVHISLTLLAAAILLWSLTRPNPWDMNLEFPRPGGDLIVLPKEGKPVVVPFARYVAYFMMTISTLSGIRTNLKFTLLGGLIICIPTSVFGFVHLARGERWLPKVTHRKQKGSKRQQKAEKPWYRYLHTFGPCNRRYDVLLCLVVAWAYGCSVMSIFLMICSLSNHSSPRLLGQ
jgi:hypothetical protein